MEPTAVGFLITNFWVILIVLIMASRHCPILAVFLLLLHATMNDVPTFATCVIVSIYFLIEILHWLVTWLSKTEFQNGERLDPDFK